MQFNAGPVRRISPETTGACFGKLQSPRKVVACIWSFLFEKRFYKVAICIEQSAAPTLATVVLLKQSRSLSGEFSNQWMSD